MWRQYDHQLFLNTVVGPGSDAAVLRLKGTPRGLALSTDGKARFCALDPRVGGRLVVLEAARNVSCAGARPMALVDCLNFGADPLAITDNMNFGNPEHPEVMWQFREVVEGISEACEALDLPVIGGNVSFYNESRGADIDPTPTVGVVGLIDNLTAAPPTARLRDGDSILLLGATDVEFGGSELATRHGLRGGRPPRADLVAARALHDLVRGAVVDGLVGGIHDCSDGGLAVALAEMAIAGAVGFVVVVPNEVSTLAACFAESASRAVCSVSAAQLDALVARAQAAGVPVHVLGAATGDRLVTEGAFDVSLTAAARAWRDTLPKRMGAVG